MPFEAEIGLGASAVIGGVAVSAYEGEQQRKDTNRREGNRPPPPNTAQPDESSLGQHPLAANGRGSTILAPPMAPMPTLGSPTPGARSVLGG